MGHAQHAAAAGPLNPNRRALAASAGTALCLCLLAYGLEAVAIRVFNPTDRALARGSVVVLAMASGVAVYLWRRLLTTKRKMAERERAEIVLDTQLSLAAEIQRRLLPTVPPAANGFEWAAELRSAGKIGGDFYDFVEFSPTVWVMLVADVSGKGIPAAMALGSLRLAFRSFARQDCDPARIATRLADVLYEEWYGSPFVTCIVGTLDLAKRTLTYSNAGHPPGIVAGQRGIRYLNQGGPPAGLLPGAAFDREVIQLHFGDVCLLVTDGVTEALEEDTPLERDLEAPCGPRRAWSAAQLCQQVMARAVSKHGPPGVDEWDDDRTVVVITVCESRTMDHDVSFNRAMAEQQLSSQAAAS